MAVAPWLRSLVVAVFVALCCAAGPAPSPSVSPSPTWQVVNFAKDFDAGDQFGAVTVCGGVVPAFVGGFREDVAARSHADLLQVNLVTRSVDSQRTVNLSSSVDGGLALAPDNGRKVFTLAEKETGVKQFDLDGITCGEWTLSPNHTVDITAEAGWPADGATFFAGASIGSTYAAFAGGHYLATPVRVSAWPVSQAGVAIKASDNSALAFELTQARAGLVGIQVSDAAWFVGGVDGSPQFYSTIDVVTINATESGDYINVEQSGYNLSIARAFAAGAYTQGKVFVAGGMTAYVINAGNATATFTTRVDIFDLATGQHNTTELPGPARGYLTAVATQNYVIFAAGVTKAAYTLEFDVIEQETTGHADVYNVESGEWQSITLKGGARMLASATAVEDLNLAFISPGSEYTADFRSYTDQLDVLFITGFASAASTVSPFAPLYFVASFFA